MNADGFQLPYGTVANNENPAPLPQPAPLAVPPPAPASTQPTRVLVRSRGPVPLPPATTAPQPAGPPPPLVQRTGPVSPPPGSTILNRSRRATSTATKQKTSTKRPPVTDAEGWVRQKIRNPLYYSVAPDGSYYSYPLDEAGNPQEPSNVIQPSPFYRASVEQIQDAYKRQRMDYAVVDADDVYKRTREELTRLYREYKLAAADRTVDPTVKIALRSELIAANKNHALAEHARNRRYGRSPYVEDFAGSRLPSLYDMLPSEAIDHATPFRDIVYICRRNNFPVSHFYTDTLPIVEVSEPPPAPINTENPTAAQQGGERQYTREQINIIARKKIAAWRTRKAGRF